MNEVIKTRKKFEKREDESKQHSNGEDINKNQYTAAKPPEQGVQPCSPVKYAGVWNRVLACLIDGVVLILIYCGLIIGAMLISGIPSTTMGLSDDSLVMFVVHWLYFAGMESSDSRATFGKKAMKIVVTDLKGNKVSFGRATVRHFAKILSGILYIGYFMIALTKKKQGLHDIIAGCLVIER